MVIEKNYEFGKFLRESRKSANLSQRDAAKKIGCAPQFISNWERGLSSPPIPKLKKVVEAYRLDPNVVVKTIVDHHRQKLKKEFGLAN